MFSFFPSRSDAVLIDLPVAYMIKHVTSPFTVRHEAERSERWDQHSGRQVQLRRAVLVQITILSSGNIVLLTAWFHAQCDISNKQSHQVIHELVRRFTLKAGVAYIAHSFEYWTSRDNSRYWKSSSQVSGMVLIFVRWRRTLSIVAIGTPGQWMGILAKLDSECGYLIVTDKTRR